MPTPPGESREHSRPDVDFDVLGEIADRAERHGPMSLTRQEAAVHRWWTDHRPEMLAQILGNWRRARQDEIRVARDLRTRPQEAHAFYSAVSPHTYRAALRLVTGTGTPQASRRNRQSHASRPGHRRTTSTRAGPDDDGPADPAPLIGGAA